MCKTKKNLLLMLTALLLAGQAATPLSSYASVNVQDKQEIYEVMQEINEKNKKLDAPDASLEKFRYNFKNNKRKLDEKDSSIMWDDYNRENVKDSISANIAKKETRWLFRLLRSQYGLYKYYGGDKKFVKAKKAVLKEIGEKGTVKVKRYQKILHKHLGFITDNHLAIGEELFEADVRLFSNEAVNYIKSENNFYREGNTQDKIVSINGKVPSVYLKRAIDKNGKLTYLPYAMLEQKENTCSYSVKYQSGKTENITLKPAKYSYKKTVERMYGYDKYDNLAYVEMNQAYMDWETPKERKQFLKDVTDMKKKNNLYLI